MNTITNIYRKLNQNGVCWRCVKRFSPENNDKDLYKNASKDCLSGENGAAVCGSCLGILHDESIEKVIHQIVKIINEKGYESKDYSIGISLPQCLLLRERARKLVIKEHIHSNNLIVNNAMECTSIKDVLRSLLFDQIKEATGKSFSIKSDLLVDLMYDYKKDIEEISRLEGLLPCKKEKSNKRRYDQRKGKDNKINYSNSYQNIKSVVDSLDKQELLKYTSLPPTPISEPCSILVQSGQASVFIAGRYNKYSRNLSQTPWIINGDRKTETSVQELICDPLIQFIGAKEAKFLSSGREDVDVRMLGKGRPFAAELLDPRKISLSKEEIKELQQGINSSSELIEVRDLQIIKREELIKLKQGEEEKTKSYSAKLWCREEILNEQIKHINTLQDIVLAQKTPLRVLHRRSLITRNRTVFGLTIDRIDKEHYHMKILTEAGTYIKEFVHGDFGRTRPSLQSLLKVPIDIIELDVDHVELDWPPSNE